MFTALQDWWVRQQNRRRNAAELRHALRDPRTRYEIFAAADRANLARPTFAGAAW
jgi:hypothetical protein